MALERALLGAGDATSVSPASAVTYFGAFGCSHLAQTGADTVEANTSQIYRGAAATLERLRVVVQTNSRVAGSTVTGRVAGADSALQASLLASTTGTFTDLTNTAAVTDGQAYGYALAIGGTSGALNLASVTASIRANQAAAIQLAVLGSSGVVVNATTRFVHPAGTLVTPSTSEGVTNAVAVQDLTLSNFQVSVSSNTRVADTTFRSRKNSANGAQSVVFPAGVSGQLEDVTNTDSLVDGDAFCHAFTTGAGGGTLQLTSIGVRVQGAGSGAGAPIFARSNGVALTGGLTRFWPPMGRPTSVSSETNGAQAPFGLVLSRFAIEALTNLSTTTVTVVVRNGGADGNQVVTFAGGETGVKRDLTHTDTVAVGASFGLKASGSDNTVTFTGWGLSVAETPAVNYTLAADLGTFALAGQALRLARGYRLNVAAGSLAIGGQALGFKLARRISAGVGIYNHAGQAARLARGLRFAAAGGSYVLAGQPVGLRRGYRLAAAAGALAIAGQALGFRRGLVFRLAAGGLALAGQAAGFGRGYRLAAAGGSLTIAGQLLGLRRAVRLALEPGAFAMAGQVARFGRGLHLRANAGVFALVGRPIIFTARSGAPLSSPFHVRIQADDRAPRIFADPLFVIPSDARAGRPSR